MGELSNPRLKLPLNCPTLHKLSDNPSMFRGAKLNYYINYFIVGVFFILYMIFFSKAKSFIVYLMFKLAYYNSKYVSYKLTQIISIFLGQYMSYISVAEGDKGRSPAYTGTRAPFNINLSSQVKFYSTTPNKTTFKDSKDITADVLNKLLKNQKVCITEAELSRLKAIPGVRFDLPLNEQTISAFESLVGKPNTRGIKAGVYIFTHIASGAKYVGSSNSLSRRLDQYFSSKHFNQKNSGLLLPLIKKEGFEAFRLEVMVMPDNIGLEFNTSNNFNFNFSYLFLEQYYLLQDKFNLNTQRIVNFRVDQGKTVYLYSLDGKILYYCGYSLNEIKGVLGIHFVTCTNCIKTGESYLGFFRISTDHLVGSKKTKLSLQELLNLIEMKKKEALEKSSRSKFSKAVVIRKEDEEKTLEFPSITLTIKHLNSIGISADRNQLAKHLDTNKSYKGYIFSKA
uniref:GIY-YIG endonuclease n=4 Tax=Fusarium sambucinum species complex TaxID=569360 RepID=A0A6G6B711_FUSCU|nr:GIY-YIG endonuclease [Fusarium vorosii]QID42644.1 GIY-YIG endonuclease [Fusarium culmorum]QID44775.1 GIY-YIG endonuclease [Fusarium graminearum]UPX01867.1 GIY-YIG endonuclease [Fusarium gerlachii]QID43624.1 GIY-YIG endonuclease [Fusarium culmorum]QID43682.1 GIY-YIG endonuclease [Fusarium culmorum]